MKIIHFISGGDTGGAKTHVLTLLDNLRKNNIDVELLCIMEGIFTQEAQEMGIPVKVIPQQKRYDMTVLGKIRDYINESGCDLVHCHGARANYIAMFIRGKISVPMITTLHSDYKLDFKGNLRKNLIYTPINAVALRGFDHILTVTQSFKDMLISRGFDKNKLHVIYNGYDFNKEKVRKSTSKEDFYSRYVIKYDRRKMYVGIAARFQAVKGLDVFLEGARLVTRANKNIEFIIVGDGDLESEYKNYVFQNGLDDKVHFAGYIKVESLMNDFYSSIDVNCLTSYSESFPYALLEGASFKCPTVATAVGGIVEMIKDKETGILVPSGDSRAFADAILELYENPEKRKALGEAFYEDARVRFSVENMAKTHIEIYRNIIG